jgi:exocyst complex component 4
MIVHSDQLKQVPDQLENLIGDKKFLQAALILIRNIKIINKPEIVEIGATSELRAYLLSQETVRRVDLPGRVLMMADFDGYSD